MEVLKIRGLDDETIKSKLKECMDVMVDYLNKSPNKGVVLLPGVKDLLEELSKNDILMGLVTGNLEPIAKGKLEKVGISHYFKLGGFGSDDINRTRLVEIAIKRAEENFNFNFNNNVFLLGDTPLDIKAGREAGVNTIGVAAGVYSEDQLKEGGADFVFADLTKKDDIIKVIQNG